MAFNPNKHDVLFNNQGFRVSSLVKSSAPDLVPTFNVGQQGEGELDLLKTTGLRSFEGGMFQTTWQDDKMAESIIGGFVNRYDGKLYSVPQAANYNTAMPRGNPTAWAEFNGYLYVVYRASATNSLYKFDTSGVRSTVALPAAISGGGTVTCIFVYKDALWFSYTGTMQSMSTADAFTVKTGITKYVTELNGKMYGINGSSVLYIYDEASAAWTNIGVMGRSAQEPKNLVTFNHRVYSGKPDGLYAYDGIQIIKVIDKATNQNTSSFMQLAELEGWLYFNIGRGVVQRFNGLTVEEVAFLEGHRIYDIVSAEDRIWILSSVGAAYPWLEESEVGTQNVAHVFCYDGVGLFLYNNSITTQTSLSMMLSAFSDKVIAWFNGVAGLDGYGKTVSNRSTEYLVATVSEQMKVITSEFDGGFPNVDKALHAIEIDFDPNYNVDYTVLYSYKNNAAEWSAWVTLGTVTSLSVNGFQWVESPQNFRSIRIKVTTPNGDTVSKLEKISFRWTLHPRKRFQYQVGLIAHGADKYNAIEWRDGEELTEKARDLREVVYAAHRNMNPVGFLPPDFNQLAAPITDSYTGLITLAQPTALLRDDGFIQIGDEVLYYEYKTATQLYITIRGWQGTTPAAHTTAEYVQQYHKVYVTHIPQERYLLDENSRNVDKDLSYGIETELLVMLTEVD